MIKGRARAGGPKNGRRRRRKAGWRHRAGGPHDLVGEDRESVTQKVPCVERGVSVGLRADAHGREQADTARQRMCGN